MRRKKDDDTDLSDMHSGARGGKITIIQGTEICEPSVSKTGFVTVRFKELSFRQSGNRQRTKAMVTTYTLNDMSKLVAVITGKPSNDPSKPLPRMPRHVAETDIIKTFKRMCALKRRHDTAQKKRTAPSLKGLAK